MLVKDYASLEAGIDKGEPSRLLIEIALRPASLAGPVPAYDPGEVQRAIRDGFREVLTQVELDRLARTTKPPKSWARRWFGRAFAFMLCAAIGSVATLLLSASHTAPQYAVGSMPPPPAEQRGAIDSNPRAWRIRNRPPRPRRRAPRRPRRRRVRLRSGCTNSRAKRRTRP